MIDLMRQLFLIVSMLAWLPVALAEDGGDQGTVLSGAFCETSTPVPAAGCAAQPIALPHNWVPAEPGVSLGFYRFEMKRPPPGRYALLVDRLSLDGAVRIDGETVIDHLAPDSITRQRYWPLIGRFEVGRDSTGPLTIEATVRGHSATKNGLGAVRIVPFASGERTYRNALLIEVIALAALAAGGVLAGLMGLLVGDRDGQLGRVLSVVSWLSIISGLRCFHNLITAPPLGPVEWLALGNWLLALVSLQASHVVIAYFYPQRSWRTAYLAASIIIAIVIAVVAYTPASESVINGLFVLLAAAALVLILRLIETVIRKPDTLGVSILAAFSLVLITGVHDLIIHLGASSLSDRYVQTWALPIVVILSVMALARRAAQQRHLERALQQANASREDLLRDLHDRIGSRLVALAFNAQQSSYDSGLVDEIRALINEVRMIQSAVSADATTLDALLADLRHLYSRIGGGRLPLVWRIEEPCPAVPLTATQAIAVVRIVEEAVANALKHAAPGEIAVRLSTAPSPDMAVLDIEDDGEGSLRQTATGGGLNNMFARALQAGIGLELVHGPGRKAVRIRFPQTPEKTGLVRNLAIRTRHLARLSRATGRSEPAS